LRQTPEVQRKIHYVAISLWAAAMVAAIVLLYEYHHTHSQAAPINGRKRLIILLPEQIKRIADEATKEVSYHLFTSV